MNATDTLDYVLGQLEGEAAEEATRQVESDPDLADRVERLGRALELLLDDGEGAYAPPPDLARRTLAFVHRAAVQCAHHFRCDNFHSAIITYRMVKSKRAALLFLFFTHLRRTSI